MESKKARLTETESGVEVAKGWGWRNQGDVGDRTETHAYKMCKFLASNVQLGDYSEQHCIIHLKVVKRVDAKCSHNQKNGNDVMEVLINPISSVNHFARYKCIKSFVCTQTCATSYVSYASQKLGQTQMQGWGLSPPFLASYFLTFGKAVHFTFLSFLLYLLRTFYSCCCCYK